MTKDIFRYSPLQALFRNEGYVVVPLLSGQDIAELDQLAVQQTPQSEVSLPFYTSIWSDNVLYRESVDAAIKKVLTKALEKYLLDCQPVFANFMVKNPGDNSQLIPHQDWNFVDEAKYDSVTVWCPLVDVNEENGNLQVIPRSHKLNNFIRGRFFDAPFPQMNNELIDSRLKSLPMKAGEALILNSRLIHASPPNRSRSVRIAASVVMAPLEAELVHYVIEDAASKKSYKKLHITPRFFTDYSCYDSLASLESNEKFPYRHREMSSDELWDAVQ